MAFNPLVIRRYSAILLACIMTSIFCRVGEQYGALGLTVGMCVGILLSLFLANTLLTTTYRKVEEGQGLLAFDLNSTGFIQSFLVKVLPPKMVSTFKGKKQIFNYDRNNTYNFKNPKNGVMQVDEENKCVWIKLSIDEYNKNRFAIDGRPALIFNSMAGSFIGKDFFAEREKVLLSHHSVLLQLQDGVQQLVVSLRDFSRHAINNLGNVGFGEILKSKAFIIIMIIIGALLAFLFFPNIIETFQGMGV